MKKIDWKEIGMDKLLMLLAAGVLLLIVVFPVGETDKTNKKAPDISLVSDTASTTNGGIDGNYETQLEGRLQEILSKVEGVGDVDVMITLKTSEELIIQTDKNKKDSVTEESDSEGGKRQITQKEESQATVLVDDGSGGQVPYILKELSPQIAGILISAQGGDSSIVKNEIYTAVEALFDVPAHKIKVLKKQ